MLEEKCDNNNKVQTPTRRLIAVNWDRKDLRRAVHKRSKYVVIRMNKRPLDSPIICVIASASITIALKAMKL